MARPQPSVPLSEAVDEFLQWMELDRHRIAGTVAGYRDELARFQEFVDEHGQGDPAVATVDRDLFRAYQRSVARPTTGSAGDRRPLAPTTRKRCLIALRSFLRFAQREEWLAHDLGPVSRKLS